MDHTPAFTAAVAALQRAGDHGDLCAPFLSALPVTGVAISTVGDPFGSETVGASDARAARLDEIQLDLGEGPCWQALRSGTPVFEPDVQRASSTAWPLALAALQGTGVGAVFAFPMRLGTLDIGAVDLSTNHPGTLHDDIVRDAVALTEAVARQVLLRALRRGERDAEVPDTAAGEYSRREVHQASGMIVAQTGADVGDALLILRGHAFASGRTVREVAADVVARTLQFTDTDDLDS
ncbi:GAF and ANTAR domain-containing protein [Curtobacterium sp. RRHDQ10]|uniref:GAF and ANTAR domain-containing protein n=1 Tax=Curtobacterium phyllosphaerae TaxID=3413379 RepID=UPI003BF31433